MSPAVLAPVGEPVARELPLYDLEAERSVLGAILLHGEALDYVRDLQPSDFYRQAHSRVFAAMQVLQRERTAIDLVTLSNRLTLAGHLDAVGGKAYIAALVDGVPRSTNVEHYARIVWDCARVRKVDEVLIRAQQELRSDPHVLWNGLGSKLVADLQALVDDSCEGHTEPVAVSLATLMQQIADRPTRDLLVGDLLAVAEIGMLHGQPRDGKTWAAVEIAIAVALGDCAFSVERLLAPVARPVLVVSNEDPKSAYAEKGRLILAARGVMVPPGNLHFIVGEGCDLDDPAWQRRLITEVRRLGVALLILDPLRSLTNCADQGPREFQPFAGYLRRIIRETGTGILLVHHDTKPAASLLPDRRRRAQRASGGAIFSVVDAPISVERIDERRSLLAPDGFKHCPDPAAFIVERIPDGDGLRVVGTENVGGTKSTDHLAIREKVRAFLKDNLHATSNQIVSGVRAKREYVLRALEAMLDNKEVGTAEGPRRSRLWSLKQATGSD